MDGVCEDCPGACEGDTDSDDDVDIQDLLNTIGNWGMCPQSKDMIRKTSGTPVFTGVSCFMPHTLVSDLALQCAVASRNLNGEDHDHRDQHQ